MKTLKQILLLGVFLAGYAATLSAQQTLPEIIVMARNYRYLRSVNEPGGAQPVKLLERKAASFDVKNSEYYNDEYESYSITFYLPSGYVLAVYDSTGKLIRTAEKFKNIALPDAVKTAVSKRFPGWGITTDTYLVKYDDGAAEKMYKLVLANGSKRLRVKANEKGEFLD